MSWLAKFSVNFKIEINISLGKTPEEYKQKNFESMIKRLKLFTFANLNYIKLLRFKYLFKSLQQN